MVIGKEMTVMQVRPNYSIVYQFKPNVRIEKQHVKTRDDFVGFLKDTTTNWKSGDYFLRCEKGSFAYFSVNGRRIKLLKKSRVTGKEYLCWQYLTTTDGTIKRKVVRKVVAKRVPTKKVVRVSIKRKK